MEKEQEVKCQVCKKEFTLKKNLRQHVRTVHEKKKMHECRICEKTFARKNHKDLHLRVCSRRVGGGTGAAACGGGDGRVLMTPEREEKDKKTKILKFFPTLRKSAFGGCFADWIINIPEDYRCIDLEILLSASTLAMKHILEKHLQEQTKRLKFTMTVHVVFEQSTDHTVKTNPPVVLNSEPYTVYMVTDLNKILDIIHDRLLEMIEKFEENGSGWVIDYVNRLDTNITSF